MTTGAIKIELDDETVTEDGKITLRIKQPDTNENANLQEIECLACEDKTGENSRPSRGCYWDPIKRRWVCTYGEKGRTGKTSGDWFSVERAKPTGKKGGRGRTGWRPAPPDMRDFSFDVPSLNRITNPKARAFSTSLEDLKDAHSHTANNLPSVIDLSQYCAAVEDQEDIGSCTAHAVVGLVEYFMRRQGDPTFEGSRLFVYRTARRLAYLEGDTGVDIRSALGAVALCGVPPEKYWPYTDVDPEWDYEPDTFTYSLAQNFQALSYFRYDAPSSRERKRKNILEDMKFGLAIGIPFAFGFYGFPSFDDAINSGEVPFPSPGEKSQWAHAVMAVGYDDNKIIEHPYTGEKTKGAFKIRNSWGASWGERGYGWVPYSYILHQFADDYWALVDMEWLTTDGFDT